MTAADRRGGGELSRRGSFGRRHYVCEERGYICSLDFEIGPASALFRRQVEFLVSSSLR